MFHGGGPYHIETSPLVFRASQWTDLYVIGNSLVKELKLSIHPVYWYLSIPEFGEYSRIIDQKK